jgi:hypothetical protein
MNVIRQAAPDFLTEQVCVLVVPKPCSARQNIPTVYTKIKTKMKNQNQNGRPKKQAAEKKGYKVSLKMATEEYYSLKSKARMAGITLSEYTRLAIRKSEIIQRLSPEQMGYIRQLSGMANNINQIARRANAAGYTDVHRDCQTKIAAMDNLINRISE